MQERYTKVRQALDAAAKECGRDPQTVTLVVVSKKRSVAEIQALYDIGCRHFGENRLEEALEKMSLLPHDICWHMIGSIQSKKVPKLVAAGFFLIHSVDSVDLAEKISRKSVELQCVTKVLLQANTSGEESKHGLSIQDWKHHYPQVKALSGLQVEGWMTMAPLTEEKEKIVDAFRSLKTLRDDFSSAGELSMGMSHDYEIALQEGATCVRIGSAIFVAP